MTSSKQQSANEKWELVNKCSDSPPPLTVKLQGIFLTVYEMS